MQFEKLKGSDARTRSERVRALQQQVGVGCWRTLASVRHSRRAPMTSYGLGVLAALLLTACPIDSRVLEPEVEVPPGFGGRGGSGSGASSGGARPGVGGTGAGSGGDSGDSGGTVSNGGAPVGGSVGAAGAGGAEDDAGVIQSCSCTQTAPSMADVCADLNGNSERDCDETVLLNPGFDRDVRSWSEDTGAALVWSDVDALADGSSGALSLENQIQEDRAGSILAGANQCIPVEGGKLYQIAAQILLPQGYSAGNSAGMQLVFYGDEGCSGAVLTSITSNLVATADDFKSVTMSQRCPTAGRSARVRLVALKSFRSPAFSVRFDNILAASE